MLRTRTRPTIRRHILNRTLLRPFLRTTPSRPMVIPNNATPQPNVTLRRARLRLILLILTRIIFSHRIARHPAQVSRLLPPRTARNPINPNTTMPMRPISKPRPTTWLTNITNVRRMTNNPKIMMTRRTLIVRTRNRHRRTSRILRRHDNQRQNLRRRPKPIFELIISTIHRSYITHRFSRLQPLLTRTVRLNINGRHIPCHTNGTILRPTTNLQYNKCIRRRPLHHTNRTRTTPLEPSPTTIQRARVS